MQESSRMHGTMVLESNAPQSNTIARWYALRVQSGREGKICFWLTQRQYKPYWPWFQGWTKLNRHRRAFRPRSVIPGYIFLPFYRPQDENWPLIESARGVHGVMKSASGIPIEIPENNCGEQSIEWIRQIESSLRANAIAAKHGIPFKVGQKVRCARLEQDVKVLELDNRNKIRVEANMFGARVPVWLTVADLEAV